MEKNWLNLMNLFKRILTSTAIVHNLKNKKKYVMNLLKKRLLNLGVQKKELILTL